MSLDVNKQIKGKLEKIKPELNEVSLQFVSEQLSFVTGVFGEWRVK